MRWPLQPLQPFQQTQLQPPFGQSVASLCHPWFTTTNFSYRFPIFETSATALCGTTGKYHKPWLLELWTNLAIDNGGYETTNPIYPLFLVVRAPGGVQHLWFRGSITRLWSRPKKGGLTVLTLDAAASRVLNTHNFQYLTVNIMELLIIVLLLVVVFFKYIISSIHFQYYFYSTYFI